VTGDVSEDEGGNVGVNIRVEIHMACRPSSIVNSMKLTVRLLGALLSLPCVAQTAHQGTIYFFRRHYRGTHKALSVCRWRARRTDAERKLFSINVDPGVHRLSQDLNFQSNRSVNSEEEVTDVDVPAGGIICIEVTFADARGLLKHARFTPTPPSIARDRLQEVHPLDARWIFDRRVRLEPPEFQPN